MQDSTNTQPNLTPVVTPNTGSIEGITPVQNIQNSPVYPEQKIDNTVVSSLTSVASPDVQVQEAFMDQSSLENSGLLDAVDTGSLINQDNYATPKTKHRSAKTPFIITGLTLVVALIIAGLGSYFAKRTTVADKSVSQQVVEQSVDSALLRVDPLSLLSPVGVIGQQLLVNGNADFTGNITANNFFGNGSAITNLKAANCDDCVMLQPTTPGLAQVGGINVAGNGLFGKLGVGTQNPAYTVDVLGDINASSSLKVNGVTVCTVAGCVPTNGLTSAVTQLDGLVGNLLISNTSGSGTTITINDASTTGKGLAQFSATNFLVSGGTVNTIQDITNASIPTFGGIILNGNVTLGTTGTVFSNNLSQTSAGNAVVVNAAADQITFQANGRTFQFPSTGVANQTICTTGITCVAGGGQAILLAPGSAQTDTSVDVSIFVNDTGGGNLLQLQTAGADKFVVANNGDTSINAILKVNTITPTASFTVGSSTQTITVQGDASSTLNATGGGFTSSLGFTSPTANRTITIPNASGTVAVSASGNISLSASGNVTFTGLLPIANGGTGGTDANTARSNLVAAKSGANSDITSLSGLTTALSVGQGGTGSTTGNGARTNLGAAASGANSDITSTSALATATGLNTITPTGALTVGATTQAFTLQGNASSIITATGGGFSTTVGFSGTPTGGVAYNFDRSALAGTYTICTTVGNCVGAGGGVTTAGGTAGKLAKFTAGSVIADSIISESGVIVTVAGEAVLQGSGGLTLGQASTATGKIVFNNIGNANTITLQSGNPGSNVTLTLPITAGANGDCITSNGSGVLSFTACTGGPGGGVTSVDGLIGVLTIANSSGSLSTITIDDATTSSKGIAQFNSTNFTASSGTINTIQNIDSTATPSFSGLSVTTATGLTLGTGTAAGKLVVRDGISAFGSTFQTNTLTGNQVITIPNAGGTLAVSASGNISLSASGNVTFTGLLPIANGGTGGTDANTARSNLVAAKSGANSDITSLSGLTTALSVGQGGTGSTTGNGARTNLGAAASGANSDITSTSALATATGLNTITPTGALTVGAVSQSITLQGSTATLTSNGAGNDITLTSADAIILSAVGNITFSGFNCTTFSNGGTLTTDASGNVTCSNDDGGATPTLQTTYNASTNPELTVDATRGALTVRDNSTPIAANLLEIQNNNGSTTYFKVDANGVATTGTTTSTGNINSSGGVIQTNSVTRIDNSGNLTNIGTINSQTISSSANFTGTVSVATSLTSPLLSSLGALTITPGGAFVVGATSQSLSLQGNGSTTLSSTSGGFTNTLGFTTPAGSNKSITIPNASGTVAVSASGNIALSAAGNVTFTGLLPIANGGTNSSTAGGALNNLGAAASGANSDITSTSALASATGLNTITPTGALTVGATTQAFTLQGNASSIITATGGGFSTTVGFSGTPTGGVAYNFDRSALAGTYTICTTVGNCVGAGGGVTTAGGTAGKLAKFTAGSVIADSIISESGVIVTVAGEAVLQGSGGLTLGQASTATGKIVFNNIGNANTITLQSGNPGSNVTLTLPITAGANGDCITSNGSGVLSFTACTGGPGGGVTSVDGLIGVLTIANSSGSLSTITIDDATTSSKGIAQFNSTNFTASSGTINTIQNIDSTATPSFSGLSVTTATGLTLGTGTAAGKLVVRDGISAFGSTFQTNTLTGNQVITIPNAGGTLAVSASGNISLSASGNVTFTGLLPIANGGTNSSTAGGALTNLGAAASGANSDITSLSGLTTALSVTQGGTALTTTPTNGQLLVGNGTNYTLAGLSGTGITVTNGAGSIGLATIYGSGSNTAAQGNVTFTCPSGTGNLSGTGNAITIGSGGTCNSLTVVNNPTFSGLVTGQAGLVVTNGGSLSTQKGTDYATTGVTSNVNLGAASLYRLTGGSAQTITGFSGGVDGRILTLINAGSATAVLSNLTTSAAGNQISTGSGSDVNLPIGSSISLIYDSAASLWRVNGTPAGSGLSGVTNDTNVTGVLASNVLTLGWTGTLAVGRGGLGVGSLTSNGILYGNGSSAVQATASAANSVLITDGSSVPALSQTLPTAVQGNITSTGALNSGSITSGFGIIDNGSDTITTTGTIGTAGTTTFTGNTATFSGGVIAPSLERATAGTLAIGTTSNTTAISEGRSGITTTNAGALTVSQAFSANLGSTVTGGAVSLNSTGSSNFNTDINTGTSTGAINIGNSLSGAISLQSSSYVLVGASDTTGTLLILDTKTDASDPSGSNGGMYYNSSLGKFRCFENYVWKDCGTATPSSLQSAYTQSAGNSPTIALDNTFGGINIRDSATPVSGNLFSIKNNAATATYFGITSTGLLIQDASATNALAFDSSTKTLKVYGTSGAGYAGVSYTDATSTAVFAASSGGVSQLGNGNGNVTISLGGATDALNFDKTYTPVAAYSSSDFNVIRNLTGTSYALTGNVLKIEDQSTITSGSSASNLLYINQANTSATGNLILAQTGGSTTKFAVSTAGTVTVAAGQSYTGTGALTVSSGAATALTITGNAASTWSTSTGNLTIQAGGASKVILKPGTDSTSALEVQNAAGTAMFTVNSTNNRLSVGVNDTTGTLLVIDTDNDATYSDGAAANTATEVDGGMFYSTVNHNFMCGVAGSWQTCTGLLYSNTAIGATISTCSTACSPLGAAPIPANYCKPGRVIHLIARGIWGTTVTTLALAVYYGSSTAKASDTLLGVSLPATASLSAATWAWQLDTTLICFSTTTIMAQSQVVMQVSATASTANTTYSTAATAATTVTTSSANNLYVFPAFGVSTAGNYAVAMQLIVTGN